MSDMSQVAAVSQLAPEKFKDPNLTADGSERASVALKNLDTLWFNTGTLCNLTCRNCYIESSPTNDALVYLQAAEVAGYLDELDRDWQTREIGFTGGEPFMNPDIIAMLEDALERGYRVLVLTNAMKPMLKLKTPLAELHKRFGARLTLRVSVDHYSKTLHELERGAHSWERMLEGLTWLAETGILTTVAGRTVWQESESSLRQGYGKLFQEIGLNIDADAPHELILFPEMDASLDVPEITTACWQILKVDPDAMMCASSRMVIKRKGETSAKVVACTLLPYAPEFELGAHLREAADPVKLNHPHCARFCVLGGGACSVGS